MENQHRGGDENLNPRDHSADGAEPTADRFARSEDRPSPGRREGLLDPLPLVLTDVATEQQPV